MLFQIAADNRINVAPDVDVWFLQRFDYNKDLLVEDVANKHPDKSISWTSKGLLKIGHLGPLF
jgi:hypothetical protein